LKNKTLGIIGGGQLGRMTALAAAKFGIECHVFDPDSNAPAFQVCSKSFIAAISSYLLINDLEQT
jgi:5-(carboxyamino)imidazole ribonucleotide synthase